MLTFALAVIAGCLVLYGGTYWFLTNPVLVAANSLPASARADADKLKGHVEFLAASQPARAFHNIASLNAAADYIEAQFKLAGCQPSRESFEVDGNDYHNIICSLGPRDGPRVIVGGHYDVAGDDNPGADDNASAVAGVLELARLINQTKPNLKHRLDLIAFTLEESPSFKSAKMGSYFHAHNLASDATDVKLMISVEMIGFFTDKPGSQTYPLGLLKWFYPDRGNFIGVVGKSFDRSLVSRVKRLMQAGGDLPVLSINSPALVPGIDLSDHWGFWQHEFPAVMVTDTAFLRNPNYHQPTDTPETLDYQRMAKVVDGLYQVAVGYQNSMRSEITAIPALAHASSSLPDGAPDTPIAPTMSPSPARILTPPPNGNAPVTLRMAQAAPDSDNLASSSVSVLKLTAVQALR